MHGQLSLFPEAFAVQEAALEALEELDVEQALQLVQRAWEQDPMLANLDALESAVLWLDGELAAEPVTGERLAQLFLAVPGACQRGEIAREAAAIVDQALARRALRAEHEAAAFLDSTERVHRGALLLVLGRAGEAAAILRESVNAGHDGRADLWAYLGDACFLTERAEEANAAYVRALFLSARDADLFRIRQPRLAALYEELWREHPQDAARELVPIHAWLEGTLVIPPENGWLDPHLSRLRLAAAVRTDSPLEQRLRRFALLLYEDRSRPRGEYDVTEREEMRALPPELFERYMERCRKIESRGSESLRW